MHVAALIVYLHTYLNCQISFQQIARSAMLVLLVLVENRETEKIIEQARRVSIIEKQRK